MAKAKILIVEDEAIIALEIESQLQSFGYEVTSVVNNAEKAIEKAEDEKPDLILMDIQIKGKMDGIETAETIRNRFRIPIVFSTAYLDEDRINRAKITMPFGYVLKPILERDLRVTVEMALYVAKIDKERSKLEDLFKRVFEQNPNPVVLYALDRSFKFLNIAWEKALGYNLAELLAIPMVELMHPDDQKKAIKKYHDDETENPFKSIFIRYRHKDGTYRTFESRSSQARDGVKFSTSRDVTEQIEREAKLESEKELYYSLFNQADEAQILIDPKTNIIIDCNHAFVSLLGTDKRSIIGQSEKLLLQQDKLLATFLDRRRPTKNGNEFSINEKVKSQKAVIDIHEVELSDRTLIRKTFRTQN